MRRRNVECVFGKLTEQRRWLHVAYRETGRRLGRAGFGALGAPESFPELRHIERQVPQIHAGRAAGRGGVLLHQQAPPAQLRHVEGQIREFRLVVDEIDVVQLRLQEVEAEGLALDAGAGLDGDAAVRPLDLRVARRRRLQGQVDEILVLRRPPLLEGRVHGRGDRVRVGRVRVVARGDVVLRRDALLGRGLLRVVVAVVVRGLGGRLLRRLVGDRREDVQLGGVMREETGQRRLLVMVVAVGAAAVGAVGAQAGAVPALGAAGRPVALAGAAPQGLHAAAAAAGRHALGAGIADATSRRAQLELQRAGVPSRPRDIALRLVRPALELHHRSTLADQTARSLPLLPGPAHELQDELLPVGPTALRGIDVLLDEALWPALDLEDAAFAALRRVLRAQRLHRQSHVLQPGMIRLRRQVRRAANVQQQVVSVTVKLRG